MTEQIDEEKKLQENNKIYSYVPFFRGNAKTDIYNMTSILKCYTVEANYKYYFIKVFYIYSIFSKEMKL